ncbi:MAG: PP2C family serine/threonine-protein phosphatase [Candidatus Gracilibacteria bacterium]|jgi:hypothetical protein
MGIDRGKPERTSSHKQTRPYFGISNLRPLPTPKPTYLPSDNSRKTAEYGLGSMTQAHNNRIKVVLNPEDDELEELEALPEHAHEDSLRPVEQHPLADLILPVIEASRGSLKKIRPLPFEIKEENVVTLKLPSISDPSSTILQQEVTIIKTDTQCILCEDDSLDIGMDRNIIDFTSPQGFKILAGTDKGKNRPNEDMIIVDHKSNRFYILDGVSRDIYGNSGRGVGRESAKTCADYFFQISDSKKAFRCARKHHIDKKLTGATAFIGGRIMENIDKSFYFKVSQAGDCKTLVLRKDGTIKFKSKNENLEAEDEADNIVRAQRKACITNAIFDYTSTQSKTKPVFTTYPDIPLEKGDRIVMWSDGLENLTEAEILKLISGQSLHQAFFNLAGHSTICRNIAAKREKNNSNNKYSKTPMRSDDHSLILIEI